MKYKSEKTLRRAKKAFSLIELMIVIVIIGALTAIILPQFDVSESEAKDTGCDASNYGTLSQLSKYRSVNGVYPSRLHTGFETNASSAEIMGEGTTGNNAAIPSFTAYNLAEQTTMTKLDADQKKSLSSAGIITLAYGGFPTTATSTASSSGSTEVYTADYAVFTTIATNVDANDVYVASIDKQWYESWVVNETTGVANEEELDTDSTPITINGIPLPYYQESDPYGAIAADSNIVSGTTEYTATDGDGIVVPLFISPATVWEYWYDEDGIRNDSKISVAQTGACPWLEGGTEFRFYIAVFKIYGNGDKAKLLGTMCPEGGSLNP